MLSPRFIWLADTRWGNNQCFGRVPGSEKQQFLTTLDNKEECIIAEVTIRVRIDGQTGQGWLVDEFDKPIDATKPPYGDLTKDEYNRVYQSTNGFRLVGALYHSHASPGCLYWIGNTPIILPCP